MAERCITCGAEFFAGQQFCRRCGAPAAAGEAPTQILSDPDAAAGTVALPPRGTGEPPLSARPTERQTPFGGGAHTSPLAASVPPPPRRSRRPPWVAAGLGVLLLLGLGGALAAALFSRGLLGGKLTRAGGGDRPAARDAGPDGELALDEEGGHESGDETVLTRAFEVDPDTAFTLKTPDGSLAVVGWDEDRVEVTVTKRGGTAEERRNARVTLRQSAGAFALTAGGSPVKVFLEVKLPRGARRVELSSGTGEVEVSRLDAPLTVSVRDGSIRLDDTRGPVQAKSINGNVEVVYKSAERKGAHEIKTVNGAINVRLAEGMSADLQGSVVNGRIDVESGLGLQAQKQRVGWSLDGRLGGGGEVLSLKTVNGSIRIGK